jgi:hypothetical protein
MLLLSGGMPLEGDAAKQFAMWLIRRIVRPTN